jgi:hypothetical protein
MPGFARARGDRLRANAASRGRWPSSGWSVRGWSPPSPRGARCPEQRRQGLPPLLAAVLGLSHAERTRAADQQDAEQHEPGRVIGLPDNRRAMPKAAMPSAIGRLPALLSATSAATPIIVSRMPAATKSCAVQTTSSVSCIATSGSDSTNATPRATRTAERERVVLCSIGYRCRPVILAARRRRARTKRSRRDLLRRLTPTTSRSTSSLMTRRRISSMDRRSGANAVLHGASESTGIVTRRDGAGKAAVRTRATDRH